MSESIPAPIDWSKPVEVDPVSFAFPARIIGVLIPEWDDLPATFQDGTSGWEELGSYAATRSVEFGHSVLKEGIDCLLANRQINAIARSFEPKHEHKEAALSYLISLWLK